MKVYLIVKCEELNDQYECDADHTPITLTEDWGAWFNEIMPEYTFEVYEVRDNGFMRIKEYDTHMEEGMSLHYWTKEQAESDERSRPTVVQKWIDATRQDPIPENVYALAKQYYDGDDEAMEWDLSACGNFSWEDDKGNWWVYGEFFDHWYDMGV